MVHTDYLVFRVSNIGFPVAIISGVSFVAAAVEGGCAKNDINIVFTIMLYELRNELIFSLYMTTLLLIMIDFVAILDKFATVRAFESLVLDSLAWSCPSTIRRLLVHPFNVSSNVATLAGVITVWALLQFMLCH